MVVCLTSDGGVACLSLIKCRGVVYWSKALYPLLSTCSTQPEEGSGSVVVCFPLDVGVAGLSLNRGTVLCPGAGHFILCLVLVQLRKCHDMIDQMLIGFQ